MKLNLGSGKQKAKGWKTVALNNADYCINFEDNYKLPFNDNSVDCVHSSHLIEHLTDKAVSYLFLECHRVLKNKGILHIVTPDLDFFINLYRNNNYEKLSSFKRSRNRSEAIGNNLTEIFINYFISFNIKNDKGKLRKDFVHLDHKENKKEILNRLNDVESLIQWMKTLIPNKNKIHNYIHINAFNYDRICNFLEKAGFDNTKKKMNPRKSLCDDINKFNWDTHPERSIIVEVLK